MTESLAHCEGAMDFMEPGSKRQRLDYGDFELPSLPGFACPGEPQYSETHDITTDPDQIELESVWAQKFLQTHSNDFASSAFETSEPNLTVGYDDQYRDSDHLFLNNSSFGEQVSDLCLGGSFHQDVLPDANNLTSGATIEIQEPTTPILDQVCYGMIADIPITASQSSLMNFDTCQISVAFRKPNHLYQTERDTKFGELDERTAKILSNLTTEEGICFQIYCRTINRRAAAGKKGSRNQVQMSCNML
ncbi:uncharacterized protein LY89DRAFT_675459 [Mollisia scopiformis]|uniref:Uncharacterized protein n=1 Tax=Mollisia scopiformis TaxID=149040 RepID=A0A132BC09_MOLSC|nr:uncharacterized protein LY89DRAFT_675459 [Mollisia scopiformis]KUJ09952.1 hypothetical protein LY89DRAFT_675459 [Mollisia scopiformis]